MMTESDYMLLLGAMGILVCAGIFLFVWALDHFMR